MLEFKKRVYKNQIVDEDGEVLLAGTKLDAEAFNRYEDIIDKLVKRVNELEGK